MTVLGDQLEAMASLKSDPFGERRATEHRGEPAKRISRPKT
jgi:hypothetical protein